MGRNGFSSIERGFKVNFLQLFNKYSYKDSCGNFVKRGFSTSAINNSIIDNNNNNYNNNNNNKIFNDLISSKEFINSNWNDKLKKIENLGYKVNPRKIADRNKYNVWNNNMEINIPSLLENDHSKLFNESLNDLIKLIQDMLDSLESNKTYKLLACIKSPENNKNLIYTISESIIITKNSNPKDLAEKMIFDLHSIINRYGLENNINSFYIMIKQWLSHEDFWGQFSEVEKVVHQILVDSVSKLKMDKNKEFKKVEYRCKNIKLLQGKYTNVLMDKYGEEIIIDGNKLFKLDIYGDVKYLQVIRSIKNDEGKQVVSNKVLVKSLDDNGKLSNSNFIEWIDIKLVGEKGNNFTRYRGSNGFIYKDGTLDYCEGYYNFANFFEKNREQDFDDKIGSLDLETMTNEDPLNVYNIDKHNIPIKDSDLLGLGEQIVYAGGWKTKEFSDYKYADQNVNKDNIILSLIDSIFEYKLFNYTFFVQNLGRFDGLYLINAISKGNYIVKGKWKTSENKLLGLIITDKNSRKRIYFKDSLNFFKCELKEVLKDYGCNIQKGCFPHAFMNSSNLDYIGNKPQFKYYGDKITMDEYNDIPKDNWNCKDELNKYLHADVEGLFEVISLFSMTIYNNYSLNVNSFYTLPSLSLAVFLNEFHNKELEIKMVRGQVEKDIRSAYHGGIVNVFSRERIQNAYYYDMNSQYPYAMLQDMPVGNPIFTSNTKLDSVFGFVYGTIIPPTKSKLKNLTIEHIVDGQTKFLRTPFSRWISSEQMKKEIQRGYKFIMMCGYNFERGKDLFKDYVNNFYKIKSNTNNNVERNIAKLMLNSLYGRFGMKEIDGTIQIMSDIEYNNKIDKHFNHTVLSDLDTGYKLVKYADKIDERLRNLIIYLEEDSLETIKSKSMKGYNKNRGVPSAVQIAASISAYAKIFINEFKNMENNMCIYSDTDSAVLTHKLPDHWVGSEIGKMKLEHNIKDGVFARKKLYAFFNDEDKLIIKASGADKKKLTFNDILNISQGQDVETYRKVFRTSWNKLNVSIELVKIQLKGQNKT